MVLQQELVLNKNKEQFNFDMSPKASCVEVLDPKMVDTITVCIIGSRRLGVSQ